jgi:hypothetical protein
MPQIEAITSSRRDQQGATAYNAVVGLTLFPKMLYPVMNAGIIA